MDTQVAPGSIVGACRVERCLARGPGGDVYLAHDVQLDRPVALKVLGPEVAADPEARRRLLAESRAAAALDHPNVVPVYSAGETGDTVYIAMRFVEGQTLRDLLRQGRLEPERCLDVLEQVASALDAAHAHGLVHRDVKPSNVLLDATGHCYLADFGITAALSDGGTRPDHAMVGTVDYIAPEQIRGEGVDARSDVYALGCMAFEMLTGRVPFEQSSEVATLFAHLDSPVPPASSVDPAVPASADAALQSAMAKSPVDRPATCTELVAQLRDAYGLASPPPPRRGVVLALAVTAAVVLGLAIVAVTLLVRSGEPAAAAQPQGSLVAIDAQTGDVTGRVTVPGYPGSVIAGPWGVWTADFRTPALWRVAPGGTEAQRVGSPGEPRDLASAGPYVYVASDGPQTWAGNVVRFFGATGQRLDAVPVLACAVGSGDGVVWAAGCPAVQRLSTGPAPLRVVHDVPLPYPTPLRAENDRIQFRELAVGGGSLWVLGDALDRRLWRLDALTGEVLDTLDLPFVPRSVATAGGLVWVTDPLDDQVVRIDMATAEVLPPIDLAAGVAGIASDGDTVWVASSIAGSVTRIDAASGATTVVDVGGRPREVSVYDGVVWVSDDGR